MQNRFKQDVNNNAFSLMLYDFYTLRTENQHPLLFSCITLRKSNQFE